MATTAGTAERHRPGRPRSTERDRQLLEAAQDLLVEVGYDRLTIDAVANRVGAGKATVYRRWPNKTAMVVDAVEALHRPHPPPGTGSLRSDLLTLGDAFIRTDARHAAVVAGLLTAMARDEHLRAIVRRTLGGPRQAEFATAITAAIERGEARPDCDVALLARILPGLAFHQVVGLGGAVDPRFVEQIVDEVLLPLLTRPYDSPRTSPPDSMPSGPSAR